MHLYRNGSLLKPGTWMLCWDIKSVILLRMVEMLGKKICGEAICSVYLGSTRLSSSMKQVGWRRREEVLGEGR